MSPDIEAVDSILRGGKAEEGIFSPRKEGNPIIEIIWGEKGGRVGNAPILIPRFPPSTLVVDTGSGISAP